eukprot:2399162-Alexandrium_andersonii.AAC.1
MDILKSMGSMDTSPTLLYSVLETLGEFIERCWHDSATGCHQVIWHFFDKRHLDLDQFMHLD